MYLLNPLSVGSGFVTVILAGIMMTKTAIDTQRFKVRPAVRLQEVQLHLTALQQTGVRLQEVHLHLTALQQSAVRLQEVHLHLTALQQSAACFNPLRVGKVGGGPEVVAVHWPLGPSDDPAHELHSVVLDAAVHAPPETRPFLVVTAPAPR